MKVRLTVTIDLDPALWAEEYGCDLEDVRSDVRRYFDNQIAQSTALEDAALRVTVR